MQSRVPWILSLGLNAALVLAAAGLWTSIPRNSPAGRASLQTTPDQPPARDARTLAPTSESSPSTNLAAPARFHWSQLESDDYRQYIANLRGVGCPERVIRDVVVADLAQLYERRRRALQALPLPPWMVGDTRARVEAEVQARFEALDEEQRAVLRELLGFAWNREAMELWNNEQIAWVLLGFLTDDQAVQVAGFVEPLTNAARRLKDRVDGILLAEDYAALERLRAQFASAIAAVLTPQQTDEFDLRLQALGLVLSGHGLHFDATHLTAQEARAIVRLSLVQSDFVREELLDLKPPAEEQERRKAVMEAEVARLLGPQRYAAFARAQDEQFREVHDFSRERELSDDVAIKAWEIRKLAETEAEAVRAAGAGGAEPAATQQQLQALQESAAVALTSLFGAGHMSEYLEQHSQWLDQLGPAPVAGTSGEAE